MSIPIPPHHRLSIDTSTEGSSPAVAGVGCHESSVWYSYSYMRESRKTSLIFAGFSCAGCRYLMIIFVFSYRPRTIQIRAGSSSEHHIPFSGLWTFIEHPESVGYAYPRGRTNEGNTSVKLVLACVRSFARHGALGTGRTTWGKRCICI